MLALWGLFLGKNRASFETLIVIALFSKLHLGKVSRFWVVGIKSGLQKLQNFSIFLDSDCKGEPLTSNPPPHFMFFLLLHMIGFLFCEKKCEIQVTVIHKDFPLWWTLDVNAPILKSSRGNCPGRRNFLLKRPRSTIFMHQVQLQVEIIFLLRWQDVGEGFKSKICLCRLKSVWFQMMSHAADGLGLVWVPLFQTWGYLASLAAKLLIT